MAAWSQARKDRYRDYQARKNLERALERGAARRDGKGRERLFDPYEDPEIESDLKCMLREWGLNLPLRRQEVLTEPVSFPREEVYQDTRLILEFWMRREPGDRWGKPDL